MQCSVCRPTDTSSHCAEDVARASTDIFEPALISTRLGRAQMRWKDAAHYMIVAALHVVPRVILVVPKPSWRPLSWPACAWASHAPALPAQRAALPRRDRSR